MLYFIIKNEECIVFWFYLTLIGGLISKFFFNNKIELRYIVSDRIHTNFLVSIESKSIT